MSSAVELLRAVESLRVVARKAFGVEVAALAATAAATPVVPRYGFATQGGMETLTIKDTVTRKDIADIYMYPGSEEASLAIARRLCDLLNESDTCRA